MARLAIALALGVALLAGGFLLELDNWVWDAFLGEWWDRFEKHSESWVAIGTLLLAAATGVLALLTRSLAKQSRNEISAVAEQTSVLREDVEVSRRALQAAARPMLVEAPLEAVSITPVSQGPGNVVLRAGHYINEQGNPAGLVQIEVEMQNVGSGAALVKGFEVAGWRDGNWLRTSRQTVVPSRDLTRFSFTLDGLDPHDADQMMDALDDRTVREEISVDITYTDTDGVQPTRTRIVILHADGRTRVTRVLLYHGDEREPFAELSKELISVGSTLRLGP